MEVWVGPVIVAAFISSIIGAAGWFVTYRLTISLDDRRRKEKIRDFQIALRAEIRSELKNLERFDLDRVLADVETRYREEEGFSVAVPRLAKHVVFDAIAKEIHILPEGVIDPVVLYVRQRQVVESMAQDMRDDTFRTLSKDRQLAMYSDYLGLWKSWKQLAYDAERALGSQGINSSDADLSDRQSASE